MYIHSGNTFTPQIKGIHMDTLIRASNNTREIQRHIDEYKEIKTIKCKEPSI